MLFRSYNNRLKRLNLNAGLEQPKAYISDINYTHYHILNKEQNVILDRITHDAYQINIESIELSKDISHKEVYKFNSSIRRENNCYRYWRFCYFRQITQTTPKQRLHNTKIFSYKRNLLQCYFAEPICICHITLATFVDKTNLFHYHNTGYASSSPSLILHGSSEIIYIS